MDTSTRKITSKEKGNLLEDIAAKLHDSPGLKVEKSVKLLPLNGKGGKREIDILITTQVSGYEIRLAIECKNEKKPIEAKYIESFKTKLEYLGIPHQNGIFISTSPYRSGAIEVANHFGIRLLQFKGLTDDGLSAAIYEACQSVVYLLLTVKEFSCDADAKSDNFFPSFYDECGDLRATVHDLIWFMWRNNNIPSEIGEHVIDVDIPEKWLCIFNDEVVTVDSLFAKIHIYGLIFTIKGSASNYRLENATNKETEKYLINTQFKDDFKDEPIITISNESEINSVHQSALVRLFTGRFKFPRIQVISRFGIIFWPPSNRVIKQLVGLTDAYGDIPDLEIRIPPLYIQSDVIDTMWEPIGEGYPKKNMLPF